METRFATVLFDFISCSPLCVRFLSTFNESILSLLQINFSSSYDIVVDFTRDYDSIRQALLSVEHQDKTCLKNVLQGASSILLSNWGAQSYSQVSASPFTIKQTAI